MRRSPEPKPLDQVVAKGDVAMAHLTESPGWPYLRDHIARRREEAVERLVKAPVAGAPLERMYALAAEVRTLQEMLDTPNTISAAARAERERYDRQEDTT